VGSPTDQRGQTITFTACNIGNRHVWVLGPGGRSPSHFSPAPEFPCCRFQTTYTLLPDQVNPISACVDNDFCGDSACTDADLV